MRLAKCAAAFIGCLFVAVVRGEGALPEESCETPDWHIPEDEVRDFLILFSYCDIILRGVLIIESF